LKYSPIISYLRIFSYPSKINPNTVSLD